MYKLSYVYIKNPYISVCVWVASVKTYVYIDWPRSGFSFLMDGYSYRHMHTHWPYVEMQYGLVNKYNPHWVTYTGWHYS